MPFWLAFGIAEEFESGGGASVSVLDSSLRSFEDAVTTLVDADDPIVSGRVSEANAYVVEADTIDQASVLVRAVFISGEESAQVRLVRRNIRTQRRPEEPPEIEALNRLHGELCITHQLTELTLSYAPSDDVRGRLEQHKGTLEGLGYAVRVMRGDELSPAATSQSGRERLGYGYAQIGGAESATFASALASLTCELSIARHQATLTQQDATSYEGELEALGRALDHFGETVTELQQ